MQHGVGKTGKQVNRHVSCLVCFINRNINGVTCRQFITRSAMKHDKLLCLFYHTMLCIRCTSHGPVSVCLSVCLSVTSRCSTKTAERRITQRTPHDSPGTLVFWRQRSPRNWTKVTPYGALNAGGVDQNRRLSTNSWLYLENGTR